MGIHKIIILLTWLLFMNLQNEANCIKINSRSYEINLNETKAKDEIFKEIKEHLQNNGTTNSNSILNEEVLNNTIEELTDLSNEIETKLDELKKKEIM
ncbi:hypothetical protein FG386_003582 [Cryptosporidium ryanae]|uniref:uncharacterized protein n=1 Tax=Cryptosporidium ryanae TaxID=515981 RepID=UPI00351A9886|nr:hypothetical protein FG386_003582 [Cryptosporidium ryanae]